MDSAQLSSTPQHLSSHAAVLTNDGMCGDRPSDENPMDPPGIAETISRWLSRSAAISMKTTAQQSEGCAVPDGQLVKGTAALADTAKMPPLPKLCGWNRATMEFEQPHDTRKFGLSSDWKLRTAYRLPSQFLSSEIPPSRAECERLVSVKVLESRDLGIPCSASQWLTNEPKTFWLRSELDVHISRCTSESLGKSPR